MAKFDKLKNVSEQLVRASKKYDFSNIENADDKDRYKFYDATRNKMIEILQDNCFDLGSFINMLWVLELNREILAKNGKIE